MVLVQRKESLKLVSIYFCALLGAKENFLFQIFFLVLWNLKYNLTHIHNSSGATWLCNPGAKSLNVTAQYQRMDPDEKCPQTLFAV